MAGKLNLLDCDKACTGCIKGYKKKHDLKAGETFKVTCSGIPKQYISAGMSAQMSDANVASMKTILDPVTWAAEVLDWHCIDPDGEIWKRKTRENTLGDVTPYIEEQYSELVKQGKSTYNRPWQVEALRCTSKRKVLRIGRQAGKSESICIAILHAMYTNKDFKVLIITPFQSQIDEIFGRLSKLIRSKESTNNSLKRYVKAPNYTIELHNGSIVKGFTSGVQSGSNANAVRGQRANMLLYDEADYLNAADLASTLAVVTNYPDAIVWMSSTPSGKRQRFYDICHDPTWKEFHHPSHVNPLWSDDLENFFRSQYSSIEYQHEVLAEFGEQAQGVYQSGFIDRAITDYMYSALKPDDQYQYCIGVDWNDVKTGTTIAVVGYHQTTNTFKLVTRETVSRENWTQIAACQRIIELNKYWNPKWIYIDTGYGATQNEILHKYGWDALADPMRGARHADSRLREIVKQYDFGSKVTVKDLFTKQDIEKHAKPFLVENSIRRFEQGQFMFSSADKQLESELRGYIIDHVTPTGMPVYKQGNEKVGDHNLDALNLALVAFTLEMSPFGLVKFDSSVSFSGNFGEHIQPGDKQFTNIANKQQASRGNVTDKSSKNPMPVPGGSHAPRKLWSWPGFEHDAPRPKSRSENGVSTRGTRPTRKNI